MKVNSLAKCIGFYSEGTLLLARVNSYPVYSVNRLCVTQRSWPRYLSYVIGRYFEGLHYHGFGGLDPPPPPSLLPLPLGGLLLPLSLPPGGELLSLGGGVGGGLLFVGGGGVD
jgi:hypothetical protein